MPKAPRGLIVRIVSLGPVGHRGVTPPPSHVGVWDSFGSLGKSGLHCWVGAGGVNRAPP